MTKTIKVDVTKSNHLKPTTLVDWVLNVDHGVVVSAHGYHSVNPRL